MSETVRYHYVRRGEGQAAQVDSAAWSDIGDWIGVEVGYAMNVSPQWALGATFAAETGNETTRLLARARARRWLTSRLYAEVLPGVFHQKRDLLYRSGDGLESNTGFDVEVRAGVTDILFASVRYDVLRAGEVTADFERTRGWYDPGGTSHALSIGGGIEGRTAILASLIAVVVGAAIVLRGLPGA